jgi:hypothetical protein
LGPIAQQRVFNISKASWFSQIYMISAILTTFSNRSNGYSGGGGGGGYGGGGGGDRMSQLGANLTKQSWGMSSSSFNPTYSY